jgi:glycine/D-amino acid oxidase-like deaminating enzyme/nitrite reductase/ring-hydroxylating ferredoxin subunit
VDVDVAVIGAGITGVMAAYLFERAGKRVALIEMGRIGQGTTGHTTAKLTVGHSLVYRDLVASHGEEIARRYAESNRAGVAQIGEIVRRHAIECDWEATSNYVYTVSPSRVRNLEEECAAARQAGIEAVLTTETELPFRVEAALRVDGQAQFQPLKFLHHLAGHLAGEGCHVFEQTRVTGVHREGSYRIETSSGELRAPDVVVATQLPFLDQGLLFAKAHPKKSYAIASSVDEPAAARGMYISVDTPTRSIRSAPAEAGRRYLIVGGESGTPGEGKDSDRYRALERFLVEHFGVEPDYRWSAHDFVPVDGLPYIGRLGGRDEGIFVATGFAKWGLTKGVFAASLISDSILGRPRSEAGIYDPRRLGARSVVKLATENAHVARRFVTGRVKPRTDRAGAARLAPVEGAIVRVGVRQYAVYHDESGRIFVLSARCPHLGCIVGWNSVERSWECPCHGSRFAANGALVQGPATRDLERSALPKS